MIELKIIQTKEIKEKLGNIDKKEKAGTPAEQEKL